MPNTKSFNKASALKCRVWTGRLETNDSADVGFPLIVLASLFLSFQVYLKVELRNISTRKSWIKSALHEDNLRSDHARA